MRIVFIVILFLPSLVAAESACPSSFDEFFSRFETNREFQQRNIIYPLKHSFVDLAADPDPKVVHKPLLKSEIAKRKNAVYPSPIEQKSFALIKEIQKETQTRRIVNLHKPDSGFALNYYFEKIDGCWKLVEFEDPST